MVSHAFRMDIGWNKLFSFCIDWIDGEQEQGLIFGDSPTNLAPVLLGDMEKSWKAYAMSGGCLWVSPAGTASVWEVQIDWAAAKQGEDCEGR